MALKYTLAIIITFLLSGCFATTKMATLKDPRWGGKAYNKILIAPRGVSLMKAKEIQAAYQKIFGKYGVLTIPETEIILPTRKYGAKEIAQVLNKNGVDGILLIYLTNAWAETTTTPESYHTTGYVSGRNVYAQTYKYGGNTITRLRQENDIRLVDVKKFQAVWVASANTGGNGYAGSETLLYSLAMKTLKQLQSEGLIHTTMIPQKQYRKK